MFKPDNTPLTSQKKRLERILTPINPSLPERIFSERQHTPHNANTTETLFSAKTETNLRIKESSAQKTYQHQLLELLPIGAIETNEQGTITHQNAAAMHIIGHNWIGQSWNACSSQLNVLIAAHHACPERELDIQIHAQPDKTGKIIFIQYITDRKSPQNHIQQQEKIATTEQAAASLAHQLRTPLSSAMLYVGHLAKPSISLADRSRFAQKAQERLQHLEKVIHNTLCALQGETVQNGPVSINSLLFDAAQTLHAQILKKKLKIDIKILTPDYQLYANQPALMGALISLLENAAHASPSEHTIALHAEVSHTHCKIHVDNEGTPIDPTLSTQIFEPLFTTRQQGTGLGLSIAKQVAEEMGGHLNHTRTPDHKTRFTLTFPCPTQP